MMGSDPSNPDQTQKTGGLPSRSPIASDSVRVETDEEDAILEGDHQKEEGAKVERQLPALPKLCGAARKRMVWFRKRGYSQEEARELALKPIPEERNKKLNKQKEGKKPKRPHSDGSTPEAHQRKKTKNEGNQGERKEQSGQPQKPSYKQAVAGIRVGVLHSNFPETLLTTEQMEKIQSFILEAIVEEQEGPYSPRFYGINRRQGVLIFTCENTETAEWLKGKQDSLKPWEEASLRIVPEEEIPRARIATVYLPDSILDTTEKIMKLLKGQNKELSVGEWNVLRRSDEGKSVLLTLAVDCATANKLEKEGPWIGYKFGKVQLRLKKKHQENIEQPTREEGTTEKSETVTTEKMTAEEMEVEEATKVSEQSVHTLPKRSTPQARAAVEEERPTCSLFLKKGPSLKGPSVSARGRKGDKVSKQSRRRDGDGPPGGGGKKA
ncbi:uncharacterized protein LOC124360847 [Homalodisca vitripennis]|uniref:uncharacterized protein LOC124360847 n=1 Tax=Homalodisca vitripennis TaxID=197043 RepID=UPI001EEC99E1|nr:uncharacterized protein LOC124360847 [Homalodisca vitripennis]